MGGEYPVGEMRNPMRLNVGGKDRVMNERGITTVVKNESDRKTYWVGTTRRVDGTWITAVSQARMSGIPGPRLWEITTASEKEAIENHFAVEEIVQKQPRREWESSLPHQRLAAQKLIEEFEEAEKQGLFAVPRQTQRKPKGAWIVLTVLWGGTLILGAINAPWWIASITGLAGLAYLALISPWWRRNWWWVLLGLNVVGKILRDFS